MLTEIIVTNATLKLDGKTLMPGSRLLIKGEPAKSWSGAVTVGGAVTEQRLVVATPAPSADLEAVRAQYEQVIGKKPHHKMTEQTMQAAIESHGAAQ